MLCLGITFEQYGTLGKTIRGSPVARNLNFCFGLRCLHSHVISLHLMAISLNISVDNRPREKVYYFWLVCLFPFPQVKSKIKLSKTCRVILLPRHSRCHLALLSCLILCVLFGCDLIAPTMQRPKLLLKHRESQAEKKASLAGALSEGA